MVDEQASGGRAQTAAAPRLDSLAAQLKDQAYPPVHKWDPPFCGDIDMRIARDGTWYYMGSPIARPAMVKLFSRVLRRDGDGRIYLVTPAEKLGIQVDDAPFLVVEMESAGSGEDRALTFRTATDDVVVVDQDHPLWVEEDPHTGEPSPYIHVRNGLNGLINRAVFYDLAGLAIEEETGAGRKLGVWSNGSFFILAPAEEARS